jgi:hypothetical protein
MLSYAGVRLGPAVWRRWGPRRHAGPAEMDGDDDLGAV